MEQQLLKIEEAAEAIGFGRTKTYQLQPWSVGGRAGRWRASGHPRGHPRVHPCGEKVQTTRHQDDHVRSAASTGPSGAKRDSAHKVTS